MDYDTIIVILGKKYREVISPILDSKCLINKKGLFGSYTLISKLYNLSISRVLEELSRFKAIECFHAKVEENIPRTCYFCQFQNEDKCDWNSEPQLNQAKTPIQIKTTSEGEL